MYNVFQIDGNVKKQIELPKVFEEQVNEPVIRRAVLAEATYMLQPQGHYVLAGMQTTAAYFGAMNSYRTGRHMGIAIRPREKLGGGVQGKVKRIPSAVKGRRAHPHMVEKIIIERMNNKEYQKAIASAIASTKFKLHGSGAQSSPIIVSDEIENIGKTKQLANVLEKLGLKSYMEESKKPVLRKGLRRSSRLRHFKKSLLIVVSKGAKVINAARNIPGVYVCDVNSLTANALAPGGKTGMISVWSESAINSITEALKNYSIIDAKERLKAISK
ncbi:MAG: uL4 family ribosomal protein [Candidatus Micrarchaeia archaeon]